MGRVVRWVCAVVLAASLFGGVVPVVAVGDSPWDGPAAAPPPSERMFDDPAFVAAMARGLADHQALEAQRASSAGQAQRLVSRTEFRDTDGQGALELAQASFPALMRSDLDRIGLAGQDRVAGFLSPTVAKVVDGRGDASLIVASDPVAARSDGRLKPLDLDLVADGAAYTPDQAAVAVSIPRSPSDFLRVGSDRLGVRPDDAAGSAGTVSDGRVFYPNIAVDTDFVAAPSRAGAEVMWQLRSPASPEQLGVDVDLPAGASIRLASPFWPSTTSEGDAEIVSQDGTVQSTITAPSAVDADGVAVPASFAFDQGKLVVRVEHRSSDVRYPILVDPEVHDVWGSPDFAANCGGGTANFQPGVWSYQQWVTPFTPLCGNADGMGNGLFVRSEAMWYGDTARGQWIWSPPAGSYIMSMWLDGLRHLAAGTHLYTGLYGQTWGSVANVYGDMTYGQYTHVPNSPYNAWTAVVGLFMDGSYVRPHIGLAAVRGVNMRLGDLDPPTVSLASITGGLDSQTRSKWFDDATAPAQVTVNAYDGGLGLKTVEVVRDVTGARVGGVDNACIGHRSSPCPRSWNPTFTLSNQLPEGLNAIQTRAKDIVDNVASGPYWIQRIDRGLTP